MIDCPVVPVHDRSLVRLLARRRPGSAGGWSMALGRSCMWEDTVVLPLLVLRCLVAVGVLAACAAGWSETPTLFQVVMALVASAAAALSVPADPKKTLGTVQFSTSYLA
jgi:hypothetical protein